MYSDYGRRYDGGGYYNTGYYGDDYYLPPNRYYARYRHWTEF